ncbi:MAG: fimbrillin family protein, partial [Bacteroidales bacterium]|nr:fimbrillin family protein [Bacteroidales bacterium]
MNRKLNFMANLLLTAAVAVSCSRSDEPVTGSDRVEVRFSANTAEIRTRVTETGWTAGDPVGIYMIRADPGTLAPENIVEDADNRQYKADGGAGSVSFTPVGAADAIYYPMSGNVEFIAYYP